MSEFRVEPTALLTASIEYTGSGGDTDLAACYHNTYTDFGSLGDGFIIEMNGTHDDFQTLVGSRLTGAAGKLESSADELAGAAKAYLATDMHAALALDVSYPRPFLGESGFALPPSLRKVDPAMALIPPQAREASIEGGFINLTEFLDVVSVTAWLNFAIQELTGVDVMGTIVKPISGDWERVSRYGDALAKLAECLRGISGNVGLTTKDLDAGWDGNAAEAAHAYFVATSASLAAHAAGFERAGKDYQSLALCIWHFAEQLKGLLQAIVDHVLLALLYAAVGTALCETVVGGIVGYALAAAEAIKILQLIAKADRKSVESGSDSPPDLTRYLNPPLPRSQTPQDSSTPDLSVSTSQRRRKRINIDESRVRQIQQALNQRGFYTGEMTGNYDQATIEAMRRFQASQKIPATGYPTAHALKRLGLTGW